jgi:hypothetical protein
VWFNDTRLFCSLTRRSSVAAAVLSCDGGTISIYNPAKFDYDFTEVRRLALQEKIHLEESMQYKGAAPSRSRAQLAMLRRLSELWRPQGKRLSIAGIRIDNNRIINEPNLMLSTLADAWEPTFAAKEIDTLQATNFATEFCSKIYFSTSPPPSSTTFSRFLSRVRHSGPGKNGIPYAAYAKSLDLSSVILYDTSVWLRSGQRMLIEFNDTLQVFTPKGEEELDDKEIVRSPDSTRPLGLKNTDNKAIAACTNSSIKHAVARDACELQRGFIHGRNFVNNIIELDAFGRAYAADPSLFFALMAFFDFGSAFPSLIHEFLFIVLRAVNIPEGAFNLISSLYFLVAAVGRVEGSSSRFLFRILSGIIQGCPLAGTCFALGIDPFLVKFKLCIEDQGLGFIRACADDIGAVLRSAHSLTALASIFDEAEALSGLKLKMKKTNLIPLNATISDDDLQELKDWIKSNIPQWVDAQIVWSARYLGAYMGPKGASLMWNAPLTKWFNRSHALAQANAPPRYTIGLYNSRAVTTLSYVAQFSKLPERALPRERALLGKILHLPGNAMTSTHIFALRSWGSYQITSTLAMSLAILMRAALITLSWTSPLEYLKENDAEYFVAHRGAIQVHFQPKNWDSPSIVELLHEAAAGFPSSKRYRDAGKLALAAFYLEKRTSKRFPKGVQTIFYNIFLENLYSDSIPELIRKRLRVLAPEVPTPACYDFDALREALKAHSEYCVFVVLRTWANGWTTSRRMHESRQLDCIFGCPGQRDDLAHYLRCERLWRGLKTALKATGATPPLHTNAPVLGKLALAPTTERAILNICIITYAYHNIKHNYSRFSCLAIGEIAEITKDVLKAAVLRVTARSGKSALALLM